MFLADIYAGEITGICFEAENVDADVMSIVNMKATCYGDATAYVPRSGPIDGVWTVAAESDTPRMEGPLAVFYITNAKQTQFDRL